jgi:hypothetical protein
MPKSPPRFDRQPDFVGLGEFQTPYGTQKLECSFLLPRSETETIWMLIRAGSLNESFITGSWKFSCELRLESHTLFAEEVFHSSYTAWDWGNGNQNTLIGEVTKLTITHGDVESSAIARVRFSVTPSALLRSADIVARSNGKVVVQQIVRKGPACEVNSGIRFQFSSFYQEGPAGDVQSSVQCELLDPQRMRDSKLVLLSLENALAIASLAERRPLLLTGWELTYANGAIKQYCRRDFAVPSGQEADIDETLIALRDFEEYLNQTVLKFGTLNYQSALKQAIYFTLHGQQRGIGDSFVILFAGLETLLNIFRSQAKMEVIFPKKDWRRLRDKIKSLLGQEDIVLRLPPDRRGALENKLSEINRVSFADAFKSMCSERKVNLSDLWPMVDPKAGSLYALRNRIVHGRVFSGDEEWFRVVSPKYHLLWTLERSILEVLGWPIEKSRVSPSSLSHMTLYATWRADQQYFAGLK